MVRIKLSCSKTNSGKATRNKENKGLDFTMFVKTQTEKKNEVGYVWKFLNEPDREHPISWNVCDNPFCRCKELNIFIGLDLQENPLAILSADIEKRDIKIKSEAQLDNKFANCIISEISLLDWQLLSDIFHSAKAECSENRNLDKYPPPPFPVKRIEKESLLVAYSEIFPWNKNLWFKLDDITYILEDLYCLNPICNCKDTVIDFIALRDDEQINEEEPVTVRFNYQSGGWKKENEGVIQPHSHQELVREMIKKYPDICKLFANRIAKLRNLYQRFKKDKFPALKSARMLGVKIGRNEPCPCGSGKKYKKCCGK